MKDEKMKEKIGLFLGLIIMLIIISKPPLQAIQTLDICRELPPLLIPGDLIFMDYAPTEIVINNITNNIRSNDHVAIYMGQRQGYPGVWCVSAGFTSTDKGVDYVDLSTYLDTEKVNNLTIGRVVTATETQRNAAITWATQQVGDLYQMWSVFPPKGGPQKCHKPNDLRFPFTCDKWYCSELVWAAYYNQGIDIDYNKWGLLPWVLPSVNMGLPKPVYRPAWLIDNMIVPYAYYNEIQIDNDIQLINWT